MGYIVTTRSHAGRTWYLLKLGSVTTDRNRAYRYATLISASAALVRQRKRVDLDSAWHHARVIFDEREPVRTDPKPASPADLALLRAVRK